MDNEKRISVSKAAERMGVSPQYVRLGLQLGILPFGTAVSISGGKYTYHISPGLFEAYMSGRIAAVPVEGTITVKSQRSNYNG